MKRYLILGGAGFIGSHLAKTIIHEDNDSHITVFDNFSNGTMGHLKEIKDNPRLIITQADIKDKELLVQAMDNIDVVYHFASNPDIAKAVTQPDIDFWEGTYLTNNIVEAMRIKNVKNLLYASGSGIYGDTAMLEVAEDHSPMNPISTYGASKLAGEALICSYCHMFDMNAAVFRFANVVGPHQTHGVGYDFINKLLKNPNELTILGDGTQSKSYIYITDIIKALRLIEKNHLHNFTYFNVATLDYITVTEIADMVTDIMGLKNVKYQYTGGSRGWKGDVPVIRLNSNKIRQLGWKNEFTAKQAIYQSVKSMYKDTKDNKHQ